MMPPQTVLATGANGYIGNAVAKAFSRAGYTTYGLTRQPDFLHQLAQDEIIPFLGSPSDHSFISSISDLAFDVIVSTTEQIMDYDPHYQDILSLLLKLSKQSLQKGVKPLVIFTSGCKDYGIQSLEESKKGPQTEESPIIPPPFAIDRAKGAVGVFDHKDLFDAIVTRPTNVYGYTSSFYGVYFKLGEEAAKQGVLEINEVPETILHAMHVDDCAEAYVALAAAPREVVRGQCYNISASKYETLKDIAEDLAKEYEVQDGVKWVQPPEGPGPGIQFERMVLGYNQWVGSEKLRRDTKFQDRRQLFSEGLHLYRLAYEAHLQKGEWDGLRVRRRGADKLVVV